MTNRECKKQWPIRGDRESLQLKFPEIHTITHIPFLFVKTLIS